jgi:hypothetical protein
VRRRCVETFLGATQENPNVVWVQQNEKKLPYNWGKLDPRVSKKMTGILGSSLGMSYASVALEGRKTGLDAQVNREQRLKATDPDKKGPKPSIYSYNPRSPDNTKMKRPRSQHFLRNIR